MNKLIEFNSAGGTVVVETSEAAGSPMRGAGSQITEKFSSSFEDTVSVIHPVANAVFAALRDLVAVPETVEVEFGLKFDARAGAILAEVHGEGNMYIKLIWNRK